MKKESIVAITLKMAFLSPETQARMPRPPDPSLSEVELPLRTPMLAQWKQGNDLQNPENKAAQQNQNSYQDLQFPEKSPIVPMLVYR